MLTGRKCRENDKIIAIIDDIASPKRKDLKLSTNSNTEVVSTKKSECMYRKSSRTKRDAKSLEITSPTIKDFFQPKSVDINVDVPLQNNSIFRAKKPSEKALQTMNSANLTIKMENSIQIFDQNISHSNEQPSLSEDMISSTLDETKQHFSTKQQVTPHRIVCLSPEKPKSEVLEQEAFNDNKRPIRNKKR